MILPSKVLDETIYAFIYNLRLYFQIYFLEYLLVSRCRLLPTPVKKFLDRWLFSTIFSSFLVAMLFHYHLRWQLTCYFFKNRY